VQYRYPEFKEGITKEEAYEDIVDEEMKTFLRKRNSSKFKDANLALDENDRRKYFYDELTKGLINRKNIIRAFFVSTFKAWKNYYNSNVEHSTYVGYSPAVGIDSKRMIMDFPNIKIIHVIRNPFSAYRDTIRRPFPLPLDRYMITWNIYHSTVNMYAKQFPDNVIIMKYEDLIENKVSFMKEMAAKLGISYHESLTYPSWNGVEIVDNIAPWGTVLKSDINYNYSIIDELSQSDIEFIANATYPLAKHLGYSDSKELSKYYNK
jgi:hypothetical protein